MPSYQTSAGESWKHRTSKEQWIRWFFWLVSLAIIAYAWQMISEKTIWFFVADAPSQGADIVSRVDITLAPESHPCLVEIVSSVDFIRVSIPTTIFVA